MSDPFSKPVGQVELRRETYVSYELPIKKVKTAKKETSKTQPTSTKIPRSRRIVEIAAIGLSAIGRKTIIQGRPGEEINVSFLMFTVAGEVNITFYDGNKPISGAMDFGGDDEPRGAVMDHSRSPIKISPGKSFGMYASTTQAVNGYCTYYTLPEPED